MQNLVHDGHTSDKIFEMLCKALSSRMGEGWQLRLIGFATGGATNMVGKIIGVVTRIKTVCSGEIYHV